MKQFSPLYIRIYFKIMNFKILTIFFFLVTDFCHKNINKDFREKYLQLSWFII